jgi:hypothetical protein
MEDFLATAYAKIHRSDGRVPEVVCVGTRAHVGGYAVGVCSTRACSGVQALVCLGAQKKKGVYTVTAQTERDKLQTTHEMSLIDRLVLCFERRSSSTDFQ